MREFSSCLLDADLMDLSYRGNTFTWWNKSLLRPIAKKLDRVLCNSNWNSAFPLSFASFEEPDFSDHCPSQLHLQLPNLHFHKPFRFNNFLALHEDFLDTIALAWFSQNITGSSMYKVSRKLIALKPVIRLFNKRNFSNLELRVSEAHLMLLRAQKAVLSNPDTDTATRESLTFKHWSTLLKAELIFLRQRSHINWLKDGDSNTTFFHRFTKVRRAVNHIHYLLGENNIRLESQKDISDHCISYFANLHGGPIGDRHFIQEDIDLLMPFRCSDSQKDALSKSFTISDIKDAFFELPKNKTPGPDGYPAEFFTSSWSIIGPEVCDAVLEFFKSGQLLNNWNATTLILIPKVQNASRVSEFRPIACLNTVYKVISRLLMKRLQTIIGDITGKSQSAFIPGRLLGENVLLATEIIQGYNRKSIHPRGMLKIDLRKAFDLIRWDFIIAAIKSLGLPEIFFTWIHACISSPSFSISINGSSFGHFRSTRGLRQGDPLSPYLFVIAMEVFSNLLQHSYNIGAIGYHPKTSSLHISHLMFADDVMVFFDGSPSSLHGICEVLDMFASWSGLQMNKDKSELFCVGLSIPQTRLLDSYGFSKGSLPIRYLGLPLMHRKLRVSEYGPLLASLVNKFKSWAAISLSFAGRTQLIRSVISGIITFWITTFPLPLCCIKQMELLCSRYLWSGTLGRRHCVKVSWETSCLPKEEGGLGLRRFACWNRVLYLRYVWSFFSGTDSLLTLWHRKHHLRGRCFWAINPASSDSWGWKAILRLRHLATNFVKANLGNGRSLSFWFDNWTSLGKLRLLFGASGPLQLRIPLLATVESVFREGRWIIPQPRSQVMVDLHAALSTLEPQSHVEDSFSWIANGIVCNGYCSKKTWLDCRPKAPTKDWVDVVWFKGCIPKNAFHMWVTNLDRLPTRSRLKSWGLNVPNVCPVCDLEEETREHLFLHCPFSKQIWLRIMRRLSPEFLRLRSWRELLSWMRITTFKAPKLLRKTVAQSLIWHLWKHRNGILHNHVFSTSNQVYLSVYKEVKNTISARKNQKRFNNLLSTWLT